MFASTLRRAALTTSIRRNASVVLGLSSIGSCTVTLCEAQPEGWMDKVLQKDKEGNMDWNASLDQMAKAIGEKATAAIETGVPTQLSYGFMSGFCSGYALKKVGKVAAVVLGMGFMVMQTLSYSGYIKVDHLQLKKDVENLMDLNQDGTVDSKDAEAAGNKLLEVFSYNLPAGGGFAAGFFGGLKSG